MRFEKQCMNMSARILDTLFLEQSRGQCVNAESKGDIMLKPMETKNDDELLSEADELLRQIHSDVLNDVEAAHRLEFEKYTQNLERIKAKIQESREKEGATEASPHANSMHEAILDIVKAMHGMKMSGKAKKTIGKQAVIH
jgi:hypothetical protein